MKKYLVFTLIAFISIGFTSCDDDNEGIDNATEASIIGSWNLTALEARDGRTEFIADGESTVAEFTALGKDFDLVVNFNEEPQTVQSEGTYTTVITTTAFGETNTDEQEGEDFFETSEWRLEGSTLYFGSGDEEQGFTITRLTDSQMDLEYDLDEEIEFSGITTRVSADYSMTLSK